MIPRKRGNRCIIGQDMRQEKVGFRTVPGGARRFPVKIGAETKESYDERLRDETPDHKLPASRQEAHAGRPGRHRFRQASTIPAVAAKGQTRPASRGVPASRASRRPDALQLGPPCPKRGFNNIFGSRFRSRINPRPEFIRPIDAKACSKCRQA